MNAHADALAHVTPDWLTIREAKEQLEKLHGVEISYVAVQKACLRYRHRIEGRTLDDQPVDPGAREREDPAPTKRELRCSWKSMGAGPIGQYGRRLFYLVDPASLDNLELRGFDEETAPGRKVGGPFSNKPTAGRTAARTTKPTRPAAGKTAHGKTAAKKPAGSR